jgi:hypothetical protein
MKLKGIGLFLTFIWCWFMGVTAISIGFGALFPSMNRIAKPFVCPGGRMELETQTYRPYPGSTITTLTWYCVDESSGAKKELGIFPMSLYSGTIYGWLLFGLVVIGMRILANREPKVGGGSTRAPVSTVFDSAPAKPRVSESTKARLKELKELRAADLISEAEYEEKRAEILKRL